MAALYGVLTKNPYMRIKVIPILLVLIILFSGCAQDMHQTNTPPATDGTTTPTDVPESSVTNPVTPPNSTEDSNETTPTEPSESSQDPRQIQPYEVDDLLGVNFKFGTWVFMKVRQYLWYPAGYAEMQFEYEDTYFYARVYQGNADIACWNHNWVKPYTQTDSIPDLKGDVRKCKIDDVLYTSIIWYDEAEGLTYTLDWVGPGEQYLDIAAIVFKDILNDPIDVVPYV